MTHGRVWESSIPVAHFVSLLFVIGVFFACVPEAESQDKYAGDAVIPEPGGFLDADFSHHNGGKAAGDVISLTGIIVNEQGQPLPGAIVFIKQTDSQGRYRDQAERAGAVDPHFQYEGWIKADEHGRFVLMTIAPGAYVGSRSQVPHIHIQARHGGIRSYYHTIMFPQYPPRNGDMGFVNRTDKWSLIVDLAESSKDGIRYIGEFRLVAF